MQCTLPTAARKGRRPVERSATFEATGRGQGRLTITISQETVVYRLTEIGSDIGGRGFQLDKPPADGGESYSVLIADEVATVCDCIGFTHVGQCKHVDALRAVLASGELPPLDPDPEPLGVILDAPHGRVAPDCIPLVSLNHPCPACHVREADERGNPCDTCKAEIQADINRLSYNGRYLVGPDADQDEQLDAA